MTDTLAIEALYTAVSLRFVAEYVPATNVFGWRRPGQVVEGNRIAWVPGDTSGGIGKTIAPRNPGGTPRSLGTLQELFTVTISASDDSAPDDELAQYRAARLLRDAWFRAVYRAAHGTFAIVSETWLDKIIERRHGAALRIVFSLDAMIPDSAYPGEPASVPVAVGAAVAVTLDDVTETITTPSPP